MKQTKRTKAEKRPTIAEVAEAACAFGARVTCELIALRRAYRDTLAALDKERAEHAETKRELAEEEKAASDWIVTCERVQKERNSYMRDAAKEKRRADDLQVAFDKLVLSSARAQRALGAEDAHAEAEGEERANG